MSQPPKVEIVYPTRARPGAPDPPTFTQATGVTLPTIVASPGMSEAALLKRAEKFLKEVRAVRKNPPGSGAQNLVRQFARWLASRENVVWGVGP